jgi:O-antigen ligase
LKSQNPFLELILTTLLLLVIASGLINSEYFYSSTTIAYYGFCITALVFTITPPHFYITENKLITPKTPILLFGLWCLYVLAHYFTQTGTLSFTIYSVTLFLLLFKATALFSIPNFKFKLFFIGIAIIATIESVYCITQYFGWFSSQSKLFAVTGSWNNPNVTAIFLALTVPVFLYLFQGKYKKIVFSAFLSLLIALLLLKCRAAFIGTALSFIVYYGLEYQLTNWIRNKKNRTSAKALFILGLLIIIPLSSQLYNAKKASADGRKFIWKVATNMAIEKPISGYGYGYFEKEYNLYQANYIRKGKATQEELANAGPVIMPHNELLLNAVEGGSIGLALIVLFFCSLFIAVKQKKKLADKEYNIKTDTSSKNSIFNLSYAGIVAFVGMSMVNSTIQIAPIMCLLVIYAAIVCSLLEPIQIPIHLTYFVNNKIISVLFKMMIIVISFYLLYLLFGLTSADRQNKKAVILKKEGHYEQALQIMPDLEPILQNHSDYWKNYGSIYFEMHNYKATLSCLNRAQKLSSLPELYIGKGMSYEQLKQYSLAVQNYEQLVLLNPSKFSYRFMLMNGYLKIKDTARAIIVASEMIKLKPKIPSEKVQLYKQVAKALLRKLNVPEKKLFKLKKK